MKIVSTFLILFLLISCEEKKQIATNQIPVIKTVKERKIISIDSTQLNGIKDTLVLAFYSANNDKTFWIGDSIRKKILPLLNNVAQEGLFTKGFDLKRINKFETKNDSLSDADLVTYDILLTQNLSRYVQKVSKGKLNPNKLYTDWDLKENDVNLRDLLLNFQKKDSFNSAVKLASPNHIVYKRLKEALRIVNTFPKEDYRKIEIDKKIVLHDSNPALIDIKNKLIYWKDLKDLDSLTPIFDEETELALKKFQMRHGLAPDGVIGRGTVLALNFSKKRRKEQIIANMERWRWYPREFKKEYFIINIPDYKLHVIKDIDTTKMYKVIVGRFKRKTPVLSSKLSYLVLNPTWTIPPTILEEDVIPATIKDRNYLIRKNIKVYDSNNQIVDSLTWNLEKAGTYRYVQSIGAYNALGLVKFMFQNRFTIYIHDTNSKSYFLRNNRALSSGCIRVQDPLKLAEYVLDDSEKWNLKEIKEVIKKGKSKTVGLKKDIDIHIFYWTAWSENGLLQFRDDLYNLDRELYKNLSE